jgi:hypothetical protein
LDLQVEFRSHPGLAAVAESAPLNLRVGFLVNPRKNKTLN